MTAVRRRMVYYVRERGAYFHIFDSFVLKDHNALNRLAVCVELGREYVVGFTDDIDAQLNRFADSGFEMFDLSPAPDRRTTIEGLEMFDELPVDYREPPTPATFILPRILAVLVPLKHPLD